MGGAVGGAATGERERLHVEAELRQRLRDVDLICEADPPLDLLDEAERVCRQHFAVRDVDRLADRAPATLATYVAIRGAERYEGIALWPQLGVTDIPSWHVGQAFLQALRHLDLPDFQDMVRRERARTYVAPILIHGGIPAEHAHRLVERLELELRRGLTGGAEAVRRLTTHPEGLGRPTARLLRYVPDFASELVDVLIDHITGTERRSSRRGIPRHLQDALDQGDVAGRRRLRRMRVPYVEFDDWAGYGPTVVCPDGAGEWIIDDGRRAVQIEAGESAEVEPCDRLSVQSRGQRRTLWNRPVLWFTDLGRIVPPDAPLPPVATVLLPRGWTVRDEVGRRLPEVREGAGLSGAWSRHYASTLDLTGIAKVRAVPPDDPAEPPIEWSVAAPTDPSLHGDLVTGVSTVAGEPVFSSMPLLRMPGGGRLFVQCMSDHGARQRRTFEPTDAIADGVDLASWLGGGPASGRLQVRTSDGRRYDLPLTVVPGLRVAGLDRPYAPDTTGVAQVTAEGPGGVEVSVDVPVPRLVDHVTCPATGPLRTELQLDVPRVRWALRTGRPSRLELAPGAIAAEVDELLAEDVWLLVRCGRASRVALGLYVDGEHIQAGGALDTRRTGGRDHQCAFPLSPYRDTLRRHRGEPIELRCVVDGVSMTAVVCGPAASRAPRSWRVHTAPIRPRKEPAAWSGVDWMSGPRSQHRWDDEPLAKPSRALANRALPRLRALDAGDQVVTFVRMVGAATRDWASPGSQAAGPEVERWGPGGHRWAALARVADELWLLEGVRYRNFAGQKLEDSLGRWMRRIRDHLRHLDKAQRQQVEHWTFGRLPPLGRIDSWTFTRWVAESQPRSPGASGVDHFPAALLYHVLALAGGDADSGIAVAAAAELAPASLLELVAFLLEVARKGRPLRRPVVQELDDGEPDRDQADGTDRAAAARPGAELARLCSLDGCRVEVRDGEVRITPLAAVGPPAIRLWSTGPRQHALALAVPRADGGDLLARVPPDLCGPHLLTVADPRSIPLAARDAVHVELDGNHAGAKHPVEVSTRDLRQLARSRSLAQVEQVARAVQDLRISGPSIERLFMDEDAATRALTDYARAASDSAEVDRIAIAVLPAAMLFSCLPLPAADGRELRRSAPVLWAALGPRAASEWCALGWPKGSGFGAGSRTYDDVLVFARKQSGLTRDRPSTWPTVRYETPPSVVADPRVRETVRLLERREVDPTFADLVVATYCAIAVEAVTIEATRLLVATHHHLPDTTTRAVLVGTSLYLASTTNHRGPA